MDPAGLVPRRLCRRDPGSFQNFLFQFTALRSIFQEPLTFFCFRQRGKAFTIYHYPRMFSFCRFNQTVIMFVQSFFYILGYSHISCIVTRIFKNVEMRHENFGNCLGTPASPSDNNGMLLHTPQTRIHKCIVKQKELLFKSPFCVTRI